MPLGASRLAYLAKTAAAGAAQRDPLTITTTNAVYDTGAFKFGGTALKTSNTSTDYISIAANDIGLTSSTTYTIEMWINVNGADKGMFMFDGVSTNQPYMYFNGTNNNISVQFPGDTSMTSASSTVSDFTWTHIALVVDSGSATLYIDGVSRATATVTTYFGAGGDNLRIGYDQWGSGYHWLDEIRISSTARYTSGFTPSSEPFVNDSDTIFLCHCDGTNGDSTFIDDNGDRMPLGMNAINGAVISTTTSKFGTRSLDTLGASSGDYVNIGDDLIPAFGTGDYTIEFHARIENLSSFNGLIQLTPNSSTGLSGTYTNGIAIQLRSSTGNWRYICGSGGWQEDTTSGGPSASTWYHLALVRSGTTATLYVDGTGYKTSTDSTNYPSNLYGALGGIVNTSNTNNGYLDEIRISSTARYTSDFTAPSAPFENDADTIFLAHFEEGANGTTEMFDDNGHTNY